MSSKIIGMILVTKHYCIYTITSISDPVGKMSWYLNLLFRLKIKSLIDHTWAKRGVSVCFHYLKVNTCNVYTLYVVIVLVLNPFHTIFSLVTSLPYPLDIKSIFLNSNSTSMSTMKLCILNNILYRWPVQSPS